jgi:hypothetical protein
MTDRASERLCMFTPDSSNETRFVGRKTAADVLRSYRRNGFVRRDQDMHGAYWLTNVLGERHHLDTWG